MPKTQRAEVIVTCNATQAKRMLDEIRTHAEQLRQKYKQMAQDYQKVVAAEGAGSQRAKQMNRDLAALEKRIKALDTAVVQNKQELGDIDKILKNLAGSTTRQLRSALARLKRELENTSGQEQTKLRQIRSQMQQIQTQITRNTGEVKKHGGAWSTAMKNITAYIGMFAGLHQAIAKVGQIFRKNLDMSDQLSQIRMVSGLAMKDVKRLSDALKGLDTRSSLSELQEIAYQGSKLGFGQYGVSGLKEFTEAANQVNVALKEQMGEDTLPMMSKMVENMGLIKKMGVEKALLATGSAMFRLSSSSTSSAGNIMEFAKRLAGLASTSHITTDQLLALGSASDSMMLMPEVAATAFNKFITSLQAQPKTIAKAFHIPQEELLGMLKAGKTMDAMVLIFEKMNRMGGMNALKPLFKDMGSDGARLNAVMVSMAKNVDMLKTHLDTSNAAFNEASDVTKEYNLRQETAEGYLERANNLWSKAFVNKDGVDIMKNLTKQWYNLSQAMTTSYSIMVPLKAMLLLIVGSFKLMMLILPELIAFFGAAGLARSVIFLTGVFKDLRNAIIAAHGAQVALNAAQKANIFGAVAAGLMIVAQAAVYLYHKMSDAKDVQDEYNNSIRQMKSDIAAARMEVDGYRSAIDKAKKGTQERHNAIKQFNNIYGRYLNHLLTEKSTAEDVAAAYERVCNALQRKIVLEAQNKDIEKEVTPRYGWSANKLEALNTSLQGTRYKPYGGAVAQGFVADRFKQGKSIQQIIRDFASQYGLTQKTSANKNPITSADVERIIRYRGASDTQIFNNLPRLGSKAESDAVHRLYNWRMTPQMKSGGKMVANQSYNAEAVILRRFADFASQYFTTLQKEQGIQKKYEPFLPPEPEEDPITLENDAAEQKAQAKAQRAAAAAERARIAKAKKALNDEMKRAKEESTAIISNIEAYYNLQSKAIDEMGPGGKNERYTTEEITALQAELRQRELKALANARYAIAGKPNDFENIRTTQMGNGVDRFDTSERSDDLLKQIRGVDLAKAHASLAKFNGSDAVYGINAGAILDEINKNATENEKQLEEVRKKMAEAQQQTLDQIDDFGKLRREMYDRMIKQGLNIVPFTRAARQVFPYNATEGTNYASSDNGKVGPDELNGGSLPGTTVSAYRPRSQHPAEDLLNAVQHMGYHPYVGDVSNDRNMYTWLRGFTSNYQNDENGNPVMADWAKSLPDIADWMQQLNNLKIDPELGFPDDDELKEVLDPIRKKVQMFYMDMIYYADNYYEQRKKHYDDQKKIVDEMWNRSSEKQIIDEENRALTKRSQQEAIYGKPQNDWQPFGFSKTVRNDDTEMAQRRLELQRAQQQYLIAMQKDNDPTFLKQYLDKIDEAQNALEQTVATRVTNRMSQLKQWTDPIEQLGTAMGEAFAQMTEDAEKGRDAVKAALLDMVKAYAQSTISIINELMLRKVKEELIRKQSAKSKANGGNGNALFNDNGFPTGTIENANISVSNANVNGQPSVAGQPQVDANGNPIAPGTTTNAPAVDANGNPIVTTTANGQSGAAPAPSANLQQQGAAAATNVVNNVSEGGGIVDSIAGAAMGAVTGDLTSQVQDDVYGRGGNQQQKKANQDQEQEQERHQKKSEQSQKAHNKKKKKEEQQTNQDVRQETKESNKESIAAQKTFEVGKTTIDETMAKSTEDTSKEMSQANTQQVSQDAQTDTQGGIVSGAAKIIAKLGWWGIPLVAVITALLNGLLSAFLSKLGKGSSSSSKQPNTKLKTGMLTYDSGNVQEYKGILDGKSYPVVGNDGKVYAATSVPEAVTGIVDSPIATMINGQPSLVGERGPEMVIGRETTAAMMMNRPDLLREIVRYDKNRSGATFRAYDSGNVQELAGGSESPNNGTMTDEQTQATLDALTVAVSMLTKRLNEPIYAQNILYGRGGLVDALAKGNNFVNRHK